MLLKLNNQKVKIDKMQPVVKNQKKALYKKIT